MSEQTKCGIEICPRTATNFVTEDYYLCDPCAEAFRLGYREAEGYAERRSKMPKPEGGGAFVKPRTKPTTAAMKPTG